MVKYVAIMLTVVGMLMVVDMAQARGRRGGCPGGNCYAGNVVVVPAKTAAVVEPAAVAETAPAAATVVTVQPAPRYITTTRRWFFRR